MDFAIQESKGDLRRYVLTVAGKWSEEIGGRPVMVFDREGYGGAFFSALVSEGVSFVTWQEHADAAELAALEADRFTAEFDLNGKRYAAFEETKAYHHALDDAPAHCFQLRRIFLWNRSSNRRACGLAWDGGKTMSTVECACAILHRWGASENSLKHIQERRPFHYHPGFKLMESEHQEIASRPSRRNRT